MAPATGSGRAALPQLEQAVVFFEDRHFYRHPGVNPFSVVRAAAQNAASGRVVSGASTITMQLARRLRDARRSEASLSSRRRGGVGAVVAKAAEALAALRLELHFSKREILRAYLDHVPYGGNLVGVDAAAWRLFGKPPRELSWGEAAYLAVLPNAPALRAPDGVVELRGKRDRLLGRMHAASLLGGSHSAAPPGSGRAGGIRGVPFL